MPIGREESKDVQAAYSTRLSFDGEERDFGTEDRLTVAYLNLETRGMFTDGELHIHQTINGNGISNGRSRGLDGNVAIVYSTSEEEKGPTIIKMRPEEVLTYTSGKHAEIVALIESAYNNGRVLPERLGQLVRI